MFEYCSKEYPHVFSSTYLKLVELGEETGRLDKNLIVLTEYLKYKYDIRNKLLQSILYPLFVLLFSFLLIISILLFVVPILEESFLQASKDLPTITIIIINLSHNLSLDIFFKILIFFSTIYAVFLHLNKKTKKIQYIKNKHIYNLFIFGDIYKLNKICDLFYCLYISFDAGLNIYACIKFLYKKEKNMYVKEILNNILKNISKGESISHSFSETIFFSSNIIALLKLGEETGDLSTCLERIYYINKQELTNKLSIYTKIIEPILLLSLSIFIGTIIVAMYIPIFNLNTVLI